MLPHNNKNVKRILLTGGGTGGSVSPLLGIAEALKGAELPIGSSAPYGFLWIGTKRGLEREMVERENIKFKSIASGKLRRYFSLKNIFDLFFIFVGFLEALFIILKFRPGLIISAGSFVSVPVVWAGWILRAPILIHQQDARPGLANKLMAPFARVVTVTFEESLRDYGERAVWTGNISRNMERITHNANTPLIRGDRGVKNNLPTVLVVGGGTGAVAINNLIWKSLDELTKFCNVIHITGKNKGVKPPMGGLTPSRASNYYYFEFLNSSGMAEAFAAADVVVTRAGMGVLTEISSLGKPAILIPIPDSHQEDNAEIFRKKEAAIILNQKELTGKKLTANIKKLLEDKNLLNKLSSNIKEVIKRGNKEIIKIINGILEQGGM